MSKVFVFSTRHRWALLQIDPLLLFYHLKTVQTIAFLAWLNDQNRGGRSDNKFNEKYEKRSSAIEPIDVDDENSREDDNDSDAIFLNKKKSEEVQPFTSSTDCQVQRPHLIVVPASVLSNWLNEFAKFAPDMVVVKYHGSLTEREEIQEHLRKFLPGKVVKKPRLDVVLTTFSYFSSEKSDDR